MAGLVKTVFGLAAVLLGASPAWAGDLNYYARAAQALGVPDGLWPLLGSAFITALVLGAGLAFRAAVAGDAPLVSDRFSLRTALEAMLDMLYDLGEGQLGRFFATFFPFLATLFIFILFNNLSGLVPGFPPATQQFSMNLALGLIVFLVYNGAGLAEHGVGYAKQFFGPVAFLAPLFVFLELVSHCARPLSLAFRLTANIFADHLVVGVFAGLAPLGVTAVLLLFGLLVACIQSFVFVLLTAVYFNLAISHDH